MSEKHIGEVVQVTGPVLDIRFPEGELPALLNAIEIDNHGEKLVVEVAQQTGDNMVRCIAMKSTDGLVRGTKAVPGSICTNSLSLCSSGMVSQVGLIRI